MTYADLKRRCDLIAGLHALADFLEDKPQMPAPYLADVLVFPPRLSDEEGRAEIDRIATVIGAQIDDETAEHGHYTASRSFGPVCYQAIFIPARTRAYYAARDSYSGNVISDSGTEG